MGLAPAANAAPVRTTPRSRSRNAAHARIGKNGRLDSSPKRNATTESPVASRTTSTSSSQREDTSARRRAHSSNGPPITSTAIPSPAHHCSTSPGHQPPLLAQLTEAPISPPASGPSTPAPQTNRPRSRRVAQSGRRPAQNQRTSDAPVTGSTALAPAAAGAPPSPT